MSDKTDDNSSRTAYLSSLLDGSKTAEGEDAVTLGRLKKYMRRRESLAQEAQQLVQRVKQIDVERTQLIGSVEAMGDILWEAEKLRRAVPLPAVEERED